MPLNTETLIEFGIVVVSVAVAFGVVKNKVDRLTDDFDSHVMNQSANLKEIHNKLDQKISAREFEAILRAIDKRLEDVQGLMRELAKNIHRE